MKIVHCFGARLKMNNKDSGTIKMYDPHEKFQRENTTALIQWANRIFNIKGNFVDIGCADGWAINYLQDNYDCKGTGVSADSSDIDECYKHKVVCSLGLASKTMHKDESMDFIYCRQTLEHCDDPLGAIRELKRILKPGGHMIISVPEFCLKYFSCETHKFVMPMKCWLRLFELAELKILHNIELIGFESEYCMVVKKE